jgi:hypothetical protein
MLVSDSVWFADLGIWLNEEYGKEYKVVHKTVPKFLIQIVALWDKEAAAIIPKWGKMQSFKNTETTDILGIKFISPKQSTLDMAETLIKTGYIPDKRNNMLN